MRSLGQPSYLSMKCVIKPITRFVSSQLKEIAPTALRALIANALKGEQMTTMQGLAILDTSLCQGVQLASEFANDILFLCRSKDYTLRRMAEMLAGMLNLDIPDFKTNNASELPAIYRMQLPQIKGKSYSFPYHEIPAGETMPDAIDAIEMVRPHYDFLDSLSRIVEVPLENLLERVASLMRSIEPAPKWNRAAEKGLMDWLSNIGFKLKFNRPRPNLALCAISHVVAELVDAGLLDENELDFAFGSLYLCEWMLAGKTPIPRPASIRPPAKPDGWERDCWVDAKDEAFDYLAGRLDDGFTILGELSRFCEWDWKTPTESRYAMVCSPTYPKTTKSEIHASDFFPNLPHWRAKDYALLSHADSLSFVCGLWTAMAGFTWRD